MLSFSFISYFRENIQSLFFPYVYVSEIIGRKAGAE